MRKWISVGFIVSFIFILVFYYGNQPTIETDSFGVGTDAAEIINLSGEPNQISNFMDGLLLSYDQTI